MKTLTAAAAFTLISFTSGCGTDDTTATGTPAASSTSEQSPSQETSSPPAEGQAKSDRPPSKKASSGGPQVLIGTVGNADDPEGFTIELTDRSGEPVTSVAAGEYQVKVTDPATIHNFHLSGPGVDETTSVPDTGEVTWTVTFEPGTYTYICDPHPHEMSREFTVT